MVILEEVSQAIMALGKVQNKAWEERKVENEKNENTTYYTILLIALFLLFFKGFIFSACL